MYNYSGVKWRRFCIIYNLLIILNLLINRFGHKERMMKREEMPSAADNQDLERFNKINFKVVKIRRPS